MAPFWASAALEFWLWCGLEPCFWLWCGSGSYFLPWCESVSGLLKWCGSATLFVTPHGSYVYIFMTFCVCRTRARTSTGCVPRAEAGPPTMECENFASSYCCSWTTFPAPRSPGTLNTMSIPNSFHEKDPSRKVCCWFPWFLRPRFIIHFKSILLLHSIFCVFFLSSGNVFIAHRRRIPFLRSPFFPVILTL